MEKRAIKKTLIKIKTYFRVLIFIFICVDASPPIGLQNIGNTCYQNAALQLFLNIPELTSFVLEKEDVFLKKVDSKQSIAGAYTGLVKKLNAKKLGSIKPEKFCSSAWKVFNLEPRVQDDPSGFIENFLKSLVESYIFNSGRYGYPFFYFHIQDYWPSLPLFNMLLSNLFIVRSMSSDMQNINQYAHKQNIVLALYHVNNIQEYIYSRFNDLGVDKVVNAPLYLFFSRSPAENISISREIKWPFLHMGEFKKIALYALIGLIIHIGETDESGHYIAYIDKDHKWYEINDQSVKEVDIEFFNEFKSTGKIGDKKIKILLYRRITPEPTEQITKDEFLKVLSENKIFDNKINHFLQIKSNEYSFKITLDDLIGGINYGATTKERLLTEMKNFSYVDNFYDSSLVHTLLMFELELRQLAAQLI